MKRYSLRNRLIASVLLVELVSGIGICALALGYEHHARFRAFEVMLRGRADSLLGAVQDAEDAQDNVMLDGSEANLPKTDIFEVWDQNMRVLGKSPNWPGIDPRTLPRPGDRARKIQDGGTLYAAICVKGLRIVDPGDKSGGVPRPVVIVYGSPVKQVWDEVWEAFEFYALTSVGLLLVTGLMMFWLLNRGLAPLHELAAQASRVSVTSWAFAPSERVRQTAELAPLALALQNVLQGLERSFSQQRQFVSDAAHELKTAVAVVKSSLQLLAMKPRSEEEYRVGLERCQIDCERMEHIVMDMLTLARIEGEPSFPASPEHPETDLTTTLRQIMEDLSSIALVKEIQWVLQAPDHLFANIEQEEADLLCSNILFNALQHSPRGAFIEVDANHDQGWIEIRFNDHGAGIEPEMLPNVFQRFYRGDPSRSRRTGGTGLGLAICLAIVHRHGGTIQIESVVNQGTQVIVCLPEASEHSLCDKSG